jgi:hypothetical protein
MPRLNLFHLQKIRSAPYRDSLAAGVRCFSTATDPRGQCRSCLGRRFCRADSLVESVDLPGYTIWWVGDFSIGRNREVVWNAVERVAIYHEIEKPGQPELIPFRKLKKGPDRSASLSHFGQPRGTPHFMLVSAVSASAAEDGRGPPVAVSLAHQSLDRSRRRRRLDKVMKTEDFVCQRCRRVFGKGDRVEWLLFDFRKGISSG